MNAAILTGLLWLHDVVPSRVRRRARSALLRVAELLDDLDGEAALRDTAPAAVERSAAASLQPLASPMTPEAEALLARGPSSSEPARPAKKPLRGSVAARRAALR